MKIFGVARSSYQKFKTKSITECFQSYFNVCVRSHPHQLMRREILTIKQYLNDVTYKHWSKASVYYVAVRNKAIAFSLDTWYKYANLLGFGDRHLQVKEKHSSLKTSRPHEFWCADASELKTLDGKKHYIHYLIDHFSRYILDWKITDRPSATAVKELLQAAYQKYIPPDSDTLKLLTDGGSENVNHTVSEYINSKDINILRVVAQKDIHFSNSQMEAVIKVTKHQFLLPKTIANQEELKTIVDKDLVTYNELRPQHALKGRTPFEVLNGIVLDAEELNKRNIKQRLKRIAFHQKNSCDGCR